MTERPAEPQIEALLHRMAPQAIALLEGSPDDEIATIERFAGRDLPPFYQWFLSRMGRSMGPFAFPRLDCSAARVIACYEEGLFAPDGRLLLIGYSTDEMMPLHLVYDLDNRVRDDARVVQMEDQGSVPSIRFETFREMIAWGKFARFRVMPSAQRCRGVFTDDRDDVLARLDPVMEQLGFQKVARAGSGAYCALYDRSDMALITRASPDGPPQVHAFTAGAPEPSVLRRAIGEIVTRSPLTAEVTEWTPPLV